MTGELTDGLNWNDKGRGESVGVEMMGLTQVNTMVRLVDGGLPAKDVRI